MSRVVDDKLAEALAVWKSRKMFWPALGENEKTLVEVLAEEVGGIASLLRRDEHLVMDYEGNVALIRDLEIVAVNGPAIETLAEVVPF